MDTSLDEDASGDPGASWQGRDVDNNTGPPKAHANEKDWLHFSAPTDTTPQLVNPATVRVGYTPALAQLCEVAGQQAAPQSSSAMQHQHNNTGPPKAHANEKDWLHFSAPTDTTPQLVNPATVRVGYTPALAQLCEVAGQQAAPQSSSAMQHQHNNTGPPKAHANEKDWLHFSAPTDTTPQLVNPATVRVGYTPALAQLCEVAGQQAAPQSSSAMQHQHNNTGPPKAHANEKEWRLFGTPTDTTPQLVNPATVRVGYTPTHAEPFVVAGQQAAPQSSSAMQHQHNNTGPPKAHANEKEWRLFGTPTDTTPQLLNPATVGGGYTPAHAQPFVVAGQQAAPQSSSAMQHQHHNTGPPKAHANEKDWLHFSAPTDTTPQLLNPATVGGGHTPMRAEPFARASATTAAPQAAVFSPNNTEHTPDRPHPYDFRLQQQLRSRAQPPPSPPLPTQTQTQARTRTQTQTQSHALTQLQQDGMGQLGTVRRTLPRAQLLSGEPATYPLLRDAHPVARQLLRRSPPQRPPPVLLTHGQARHSMAITAPRDYQQQQAQQQQAPASQHLQQPPPVGSSAHTPELVHRDHFPQSQQHDGFDEAILAGVHVLSTANKAQVLASVVQLMERRYLPIAAGILGPLFPIEDYLPQADAEEWCRCRDDAAERERQAQTRNALFEAARDRGNRRDHVTEEQLLVLADVILELALPDMKEMMFMLPNAHFAALNDSINASRLFGDLKHERHLKKKREGRRRRSHRNRD
ncbi:hypothetical protein PTSG_00198 [Salpingoeca rosetta]|uniref:Uncharacterized protein n=1 Tax=Salpingoeca rosetta (strain ATCC 50818 / BSB-021) TaxID=946362 RepID=F2TVS9_SALR5|nr:uncharacterized protein PTSG_00198 [Salpingoeca rosetta]EGD72175.1 hypothetical protein PTSG_00198 [Salpingoeca rosetta]|eukprot:XP_004998747.1 hypothetical protein PTSG_00198 [Salpingoeca rosetta]